MSLRCDSSVFIDATAGRLAVESVIASGAARSRGAEVVAYSTEADVFQEGQRPDVRLSFNVEVVTPSYLGGYLPTARDYHAITSWRKVRKGLATAQDCCSGDKNPCNRSVNTGHPAVIQAVLEKRDAFLTEHGNRFQEGRTKAKVDSVGYLNRIMRNMRFVTDLLEKFEATFLIASSDSPFKEGDITRYTTIEWLKRGKLTYVTFYLNSGNVGRLPPTFFAVFREGEPFIFVHNKRADGSRIIPPR